MMSHKGAIENAPLQAYVSALVFSPAQSLIRNLFQHEAPRWLTIKPAMMDKWGACLQTLESHSDSVNSVAFSHDSTRIASASGDETVKIWDASSGDCLQTLKGHSNSVKSVAFSHDSTRIASASDDETVKIWDASSGDCLQTLEVSRSLRDLSFDSTGYYLHTEIGAIIIDNSTAPNWTTAITEPQPPQHQYTTLSSDNTWITYDSKRVLWLPSEYRPSSSAVSGRIIGIGVGNGRVWICDVNL
jgi:WD40 repeat protein